MKEKKCLRGEYLCGEKFMGVRIERRKGDGGYIEMKGGKEKKVKNVNGKFGVGVFRGVSGVCG